MKKEVIKLDDLRINDDVELSVEILGGEKIVYFGVIKEIYIDNVVDEKARSGTSVRVKLLDAECRIYGFSCALSNFDLFYEIQRITLE